MNTPIIRLALVGAGLALLGVAARADGDHPTTRAAQRYAHRKVAHVDHAVYHAGAHYKHWKQRKGHNIRAWLNKH